MDRTLILVKPDAFERGLTGEIIARFERKGLAIVAMKHMTVTRERAEQHYAEHAEKPFFGDLVDFITGGRARRARARGPRGDHGRAPGHRGHQPARGEPGLDPRRPRPRGADEPRARLGLDRVRRPRDRALLPGAVADAMLVLASRSPRRRAILEQLGIEFRVAWCRTSTSSRKASRAARRWRTPGERPRRSRRCGPRWPRPRRGHGRRRSTAAPAASPRATQRRRSCSARLSGREHEVLSGVVLSRRRRRARRRGVDPRALPRARRAHDRVVPGHRRVARRRRRLRHPGKGARRWSRRSRATTRTWSACRCPVLLRLCPRCCTAPDRLLGSSLDCERRLGTHGASAARRLPTSAMPPPRRLSSLSGQREDGLLLLPHRHGRPRYGRRSRDRQHARVRPRTRHRALASRRWSRSTRAPPRCTRSASRPSACSAARPARSRRSAR